MGDEGWFQKLIENGNKLDGLLEIAKEINLALSTARQETRRACIEAMEHHKKHGDMIDKRVCALSTCIIHYPPISPPPPKQETHTADADTCPLCKRSKREIPLTSDPFVEPRDKP